MGISVHLLLNSCGRLLDAFDENLIWLVCSLKVTGDCLPRRRFRVLAQSPFLEVLLILIFPIFRSA